IALCYDDGNAIRWENHYSINEPDDFLLVQLFPYVAEMLNFAPFRARAKVANAVPAPATFPVEMAPPPGKAAPTRGSATASEKDGVVQIKIDSRDAVKYTETVKVPKTVSREIVVGGKKKVVTETVYEEVQTTRVKQVLTSEQ